MNIYVRDVIYIRLLIQVITVVLVMCGGVDDVFCVVNVI